MIDVKQTTSVGLRLRKERDLAASGKSWEEFRKEKAARKFAADLRQAQYPDERILELDRESPVLHLSRLKRFFKALGLQ